MNELCEVHILKRWWGKKVRQSGQIQSYERLLPVDAGKQIPSKPQYHDGQSHKKKGCREAHKGKRAGMRQMAGIHQKENYKYQKKQEVGKENSVEGNSNHTGIHCSKSP